MVLKPNDSHDMYSDPISYDIETRSFTEDIPFYLKQARMLGGPVLELACGTGRVAIPLAKEGFELVGLDISKPMIELGRSKARGAGVAVELLVADCRTFHLNRQFALIIMPFNAISHIHDRDSHEALFARVREHLRPDGRFILDWFNPDYRFLYRDPDRRYPCHEYSLPDGTPVVVTENNRYDRATQINHIKWYYKIGDADEVVRENNMRQLYPQELDSLLHYNGLDLVVKYGDYGETPFESSSRHQICVCRLS